MLSFRDDHDVDPADAWRVAHIGQLLRDALRSSFAADQMSRPYTERPLTDDENASRRSPLGAGGGSMTGPMCAVNCGLSATPVDRPVLVLTRDPADRIGAVVVGS